MLIMLHVLFQQLALVIPSKRGPVEESTEREGEKELAMEVLVVKVIHQLHLVFLFPIRKVFQRMNPYLFMEQSSLPFAMVLVEEAVIIFYMK